MGTIESLQRQVQPADAAFHEAPAGIRELVQNAVEDDAGEVDQLANGCPSAPTGVYTFMWSKPKPLCAPPWMPSAQPSLSAAFVDRPVFLGAQISLSRWTVAWRRRSRAPRSLDAAHHRCRRSCIGSSAMAWKRALCVGRSREPSCCRPAVSAMAQSAWKILPTPSPCVVYRTARSRPTSSMNSTQPSTPTCRKRSRRCLTDERMEVVQRWEPARIGPLVVGRRQELRDTSRVFHDVAVAIDDARGCGHGLAPSVDS